MPGPDEGAGRTHGSSAPSRGRGHDVGALELDTRRRLYAFVTAHPGAYLREIQRGVGLAMGELEYHLDRLERAGLVRVEADANKRFFPAGMSEGDSRALSVLRQSPCRRILMALLAADEPTHGELATRAGVRASSLTYHASRLEAAQLLMRTRSGRTTTYRVLDRERILRLLVAYRASFLDRVLDAFLDGFEAMGPQRRDTP